MRLILVGLNHETAPVELRERLALSEAEIEVALDRLLKKEPIEEAIILSTCNRTELVARHKPLPAGAASAEPNRLIDEMIRWKNITSFDRGVFYAKENEEAVRHVFRVAAGLDSMIVGEAQILSQVKDAYRAANSVNASGFFMHKLMHAAFRAGKRARAETGIGVGAVSVSLAAVELARKIFRDLSKKHALVIGAGEMARLTAEHFVQKKIGSLTVTNRTDEKACALAEETGARGVPFEKMRDALAAADAVITSTGAEEPILTEKILRDVMAARHNRPIFLIDIAVPRNVDPAVRRVYNVFAYDIDDLKQIVDANLGHRRKEIPKAEKIVEQELAGFIQWYRSLEATPTIKLLTDRCEEIRREELSRSSKHFTREQQEKLDALTQGIVKKILHHPISKLRESGNEDTDDTATWVEAVRKVFDLEQDSDG